MSETAPDAQPASARERAALRDSARTIAERAGHQPGRFRKAPGGDSAQQEARCENNGCDVGLTIFYPTAGEPARATWWLEGESRPDEQELWSVPPCAGTREPAGEAAAGD